MTSYSLSFYRLFHSVVQGCPDFISDSHSLMSVTEYDELTHLV